jgi:redox-sensitive bicupin YhaK (pirin superfamily)
LFVFGDNLRRTGFGGQAAEMRGEPNAVGIAPGYEQKHFADADKRGRLCLIASADGREGSVTIHADAALRAGLFDGDERIELPLDSSRLTYVHVVRGGLGVNGLKLSAGDAATLSGESRLVLGDAQDAEVLVFDLAA